MKFANTVDTLTSLDIREIIVFGAKVIEIYEGVKCQVTFGVTIVEKPYLKDFKLKMKWKKSNVLKTKSVKDTGNGSYGQTIRKENDYVHKSVTKKGKQKIWQ